MASANERKRDWDTAFNDRSTVASATKRIRLDANDYDSDQSVLYAPSSQPLPTRHFRSANELQGPRTISLPLPTSINTEDSSPGELREPQSRHLAAETDVEQRESTTSVSPQAYPGSASLGSLSIGQPSFPHSTITSHATASQDIHPESTYLQDASASKATLAITTLVSSVTEELPANFDGVSNEPASVPQDTPDVSVLISSDVAVQSSSNGCLPSQKITQKSPAPLEVELPEGAPAIEHEGDEENLIAVDVLPRVINGISKNDVHSGVTLAEAISTSAELVDDEFIIIPDILIQAIAETTHNANIPKADQELDIESNGIPPSSSPLSSPPAFNSVPSPARLDLEALPDSSPQLSSFAPSSPLGITLEPASVNNNPFLSTMPNTVNTSTEQPEHLVSSLVQKPIVPAPVSQAKEKKENIQPVQKHQPGHEDQKLDTKSLQASTDLAKSSPNHPSASSQQRSNKKIRTPFRSPLLPKPLQAQIESNVALVAPSFPNLGVSVAREEKKSIMPRKGFQSRVTGAGTAAARAAFKPPILKNALPTNVGLPSTSRNPQSQSLQQRLQLLRRAVKIKESGEDEKLEELTRKWKDVAKQVAWELWDIVKDGNVEESPDTYGRGLTGPGGFGYGAGSDGRIEDTFDQNWGRGDPEEESKRRREQEGKDAEDEEEEEAKAEQRTMGVMLRHLGIANETLGWDEENEDFLDAEGDS